MSLPQFATQQSVPVSRNGHGQPEDGVFLGYWARDEQSDPDGLKRRLAKRGDPIGISRGLFQKGHVHIRGRTRAGKTQKTLAPLIHDLMAPYVDEHGTQRTSPTLVLDFKGDLELFHRTRRAAKKWGRKFKFFSNDARRSYGLNPFQGLTSEISDPDLAASVLASFNVTRSGQDPPNSQFFAAQALLQLLKIIDAGRADQTRTGALTIRDLLGYLAQKEHQVEHAQQIVTQLEVLSRYPQLGTAKRTEHNICLEQALTEGHVLYFYLPARGREQAMRAIGGLVLYTLFNILDVLPEGQAPSGRPNIFIDEWWVLAGPNMETLITLCGSEASLFLANQTSAQLTPSLVKFVQDQTFLRILFTVTEESDYRELALESKFHTNNWLESIRDGSGGLGLGPTAGSSRSQYRDRLLTDNLIRDVSEHEDLMFVVLRDGQGHREPIIARRDHEVPIAQHLVDKDRPLPIVNAEFVKAGRAATKSGPPWQRRHAAPVAGERSNWQRLMAHIVSATEGSEES